MTTLPSFSQLDFSRDHAAWKDRIESCYLAKVFHAVEERNERGLPPTRRQSPFVGFQATLELAVAMAERRRKGKARWRIDELPALVIKSRRKTLLVCHIDTRTPFSNFDAALPESAAIGAVAACFDLRRNVYRLAADEGDVPPLKLPLHRWRSPARSAAGRWVASRSNVNLAAAWAIVTRLSLHLQGS